MRRTVPVLAVALLVGCRWIAPTDPGDSPALARSPGPAQSLSAQIDRHDPPLRELAQAIAQAQAGPAGEAKRNELAQRRSAILARRWRAVQHAAAHHGTTHREAFYGSRAFWHTQSTRGIGYALDEAGDLDEPFYVDGRGNVRVVGDANADIEISGSAIVHILGDLKANLRLNGVCEVVIAGSVAPNATIECDGQLELYVGGDCAGTIAATRSATAIIDGDLAGNVRCGSPATTLTVTGDLAAQLIPPADQGAILTLRVDGFAPTAAMLDLASAGFTRVNATLGKSDAPQGLYPEHNAAAGPVARWVVLQEMTNEQAEMTNEIVD